MKQYIPAANHRERNGEFCTHTMMICTAPCWRQEFLVPVCEVHRKNGCTSCSWLKCTTKHTTKQSELVHRCNIDLPASFKIRQSLLSSNSNFVDPRGKTQLRKAGFSLCSASFFNTTEGNGAWYFQNTICVKQVILRRQHKSLSETFQNKRLTSTQTYLSPSK